MPLAPAGCSCLPSNELQRVVCSSLPCFFPFSIVTTTRPSCSHDFRRPIGLTKAEEIDLEELARVVGPQTKLVAISHVSNTLGFITPIQRVAEIAHAVGAKLLVDACQSVPNGPVDVQTLGADWVVASGHKMCGPTGIGFLWGRYGRRLRVADGSKAAARLIDAPLAENLSRCRLLQLVLPIETRKELSFVPFPLPRSSAVTYSLPPPPSIFFRAAWSFWSRCLRGWVAAR